MIDKGSVDLEGVKTHQEPHLIIELEWQLSDLYEQPRDNHQAYPVNAEHTDKTTAGTYQQSLFFL